MKNKHYHKGILCQFGFHKWGESDAKLVMEGRAGRLIARICDKCGHKSSKGYFIADSIKKTTGTFNVTSSNSTPEQLDDMLAEDPIGSYGSGGGGNVGKTNKKKNTIFDFNDGKGWIIEGGVKRPMSDEDMKDFNKKMSKFTGALSNYLSLPMDSFVGDREKPASKLSVNNNSKYCTCDSGSWNKIRTGRPRPPAA